MQRDVSREIAAAKKWVKDPLFWVSDMFGDNLKAEFKKLTGVDSTTRTGLTSQQETAFLELSKIIRAKLRVHLGFPLTKELEGYETKIGLSIMSGQGTGKDFFAALAMMYFMCIFRDARETATASTAKQLKNVLWTELSKIMRLSRKTSLEPGSDTMLEQIFTWQSEKVYVKEMKGQTWYAEAVTIKSNASEAEQGEALAGRHEKYQLIVADEASGIPDGVFKPLEGTLTGVVNLLLVIFNPTKSRGFAVESATKDERFVHIRWDARDSEVVKKSHTDSMIEKYGIDSNTVRIRVLGLPPLADDDSLIPWDWLEDARTRALEPLPDDFVVKGGDFGAGGDKSVIATRKGGVIYPFKRNSTKDSNVLTDWIYSDFLHDEADVLAGDVIGIGYAIMGNLRKLLGANKARSIDSRNRASSARFFNKRAENYWNLRTAFEEKAISLALLPEADYRELCDQLGATKYRTETKGIQIIKKSAIKKEVGHSPDESDSLTNAYALPADALRKSGYEEEGEPEFKEYEYAGFSETAWMGR